MHSVLLINNENIDNSYLKQALNEFSDIKIIEAENIDEALKFFPKHFFDILFIDYSLKSVKKLDELKKSNPDIVLLSLFDKLEKQTTDAICDVGIDDFIDNSTDVKILIQKISNYINLSKLKQEAFFHSNAINLFDNNVYKRLLIFKFDSSEAKLEFWDYFSNKYFEKYDNIENYLDILYAFANWMFLNKIECELIKETNEKSMYLTLQPISSMSKKIINNIIKKFDSNINYIINEHKLSLKLDIIEPNVDDIQTKSNTSKLDDDTKEILSKTHFNKITAAEFIESTAIEFMDKIEDLYEIEDKIDEALNHFEKNPNTETTNLIFEKIIEYVDVVELLVEFNHLAFALKTLANAIKNIKQEQMIEKDVKKFATLSIHLINDLSSWRENIFIKQDANDIHYLDSSLLSSCLQIEAVFEKEKIEEDDDDFELF